MKVKKIVIFISIIFLLTIGVIIAKNNNKAFKQNGITYAVNVDGKKENSFPEKGDYHVSVECSNATGKWDYAKWQLNIEEIKGNVVCDIGFNSIEKTTLVDKIISLKDTEQGSGKVIHENEVEGLESFVSEGSISNYGTTSQYYATSITADSGTEEQHYTYDNSKKAWSITTDSSKIDETKFYVIKFNIAEKGTYKVCLNSLAGGEDAISDLLGGVYFNSTRLTSLSTYNGPIGGCYSFEVTDDAHELKISTKQESWDTDNRAYDSFSFYVEKGQIAPDDAGYRYEGENPNNYVWFNNKLWRIIGALSSVSHGQSGYLVKIIRASTLRAFPKSLSSNNNYSQSVFNDMLNDSYYNASDGTGKTYCQYRFYTNSVEKVECDYTENGIKEPYRQMIKSVRWNLGAVQGSSSYSTDLGTVADVLKGEVGDLKAYGAKATKMNAYVGIMYASDYGFSSLADACPRSSKLSRYGKACAGWLYNGNVEHVLTYGTNQYGAFHINDHFGVTAGWSDDNPKYFRPTVYLNQNVVVYDGDGSANNPYIIGM